MAKQPQAYPVQKNLARMRKGHLHLIDELQPGSPQISGALGVYSEGQTSSRQTRNWTRIIPWVENFLFSSGRHYVDDIMISRLSRDSSDNLSVIKDASRNIPRPTNDLLGRYIETNISLLTENRPRPRVTSKSSTAEDETAAELSELTLEYLWEALKMPEITREIARIIIHCGVCWLETVWDETIPRRLTVPQTREEGTTLIPGPTGPLEVQIPRQVPVQEGGKPVYKEQVEWGDVSVRLISPFEMHIPIVHSWDSEDLGWIMREYYVSKDVLVDKYANKRKMGLKKSDGWHIDRLEDVGTQNVKNFPIWWWERLADLVEGPGPSLYVGTPEEWVDYTMVRIFDRKPNSKWPKGRSIVIAGDQVLYDSPKDRGARAYHPRWPTRWHPYTRFRWEGLSGSVYGRSLISKLLPKLKRVNAIDTTMIMWRRTVPIATWIIPQGCVAKYTPIINDIGGVKEIQDTQIGDKVQTKNGIQKVTNVFEYNNDRQMYKINVNGHLPLSMTENHVVPILSKKIYNKKVKRKWLGRGKPYERDYSSIIDSDIIEKESKDIETGDYLLSGFRRERSGGEKLDLSKYINKFKFIRNKIPQYIKIDEDLLRLLGLYIAEGSSGGSCAKWTLGLHERETLGKEIEELVQKIFGLTVWFEEYSNYTGSCLNIKVYSKPIRDLFCSLTGPAAKDKYIAREIFTYPGSLLPLIGGWIDGDGSSQDFPQSKDGRTRTFKLNTGHTTSRNLAFQIQSILLDEKIPTNICIDSKNRKNPKFILGWDTQSRRDLSSYCRKFEKDTSQKTGRQGFWIGDLYASRVKKIEKIPYTGKVYDLEVEGDHHYQANGIIVHNSQPINDLWSGSPGKVYQYDPRRTGGAKPEPVYPPDYPQAALNERQQQIAEMEAIAGTEEILRGQRPVGTTCWVEGSKLLDSNAVPTDVSKIKVEDELITMRGVGLVGVCHKQEYEGPVVTIKSYGNLPVTTTPNHEFPVFDLKRKEVVRKCADNIQPKKDLLLTGFERIKTGSEKLDIASLGGTFKPGCGGERHGQAKISNIQAEEIRERLRGGEEERSLAREFGVSEASISKIKTRTSFNGVGKTRGHNLPAIVRLSDDVLWLLGIYLAEGCIVSAVSDGEPTTVQWSLHEDETDIADKIVLILNREFGIDHVRNFIVKDDRKARYVQVCNRALARLFLRLLGTKSDKKKIAPELFQTPVSLLPLVAGWADGDGDRDGNTLRISSVSFALASQMRAILLDKKIYSCINVLHRPEPEHDDIYTINITGVNAKSVVGESLRFHEEQFNSSFGYKGRRGFWVGDKYVSYVYSSNSKPYAGTIYNVTMNELRGKCDNSVNSLVFSYQSASMINILRKQALASRSPIIQSWDESIQDVGSNLLQEVIKHVRDDPRYAERIRILARENTSRLTIDTFSGQDLSDNVVVRVDTASMALVSKEAREARAIDFLQYAGNLMVLPLGLRQAIVDELGFSKSLTPQGPDVNRAKRMISWVRNGDFQRVIPMIEDDPYVFYEFLVKELKDDSFFDLNEQQQFLILQLIEKYRQQIEVRERQMLKLQQMQAQAGNGKAAPEEPV